MSSKPSYLIESDPRKNFMRLTFSGHMDHATLDRFEQELAAAFARMPAKGDCRFLSDIRDAGVQSRDITERLQAIIAHYIVRFGSLTHGIAMLVSGSSLEMMQAKRVAGGGGTAFFLSEDDASEWLFGETTDVLAKV